MQYKENHRPYTHFRLADNDANVILAALDIHSQPHKILILAHKSFFTGNHLLTYLLHGAETFLRS